MGRTSINGMEEMRSNGSKDEKGIWVTATGDHFRDSGSIDSYNQETCRYLHKPNENHHHRTNIQKDPVVNMSRTSWGVSPWYNSSIASHTTVVHRQTETMNNVAWASPLCHFRRVRIPAFKPLRLPIVVHIAHAATPTNWDGEEYHSQPRQYDSSDRHPHRVSRLNNEISPSQPRDFVFRDDNDGKVCGKNERAQERVDDGGD